MSKKTLPPEVFLKALDVLPEDGHRIFLELRAVQSALLDRSVRGALTSSLYTSEQKEGIVTKALKTHLHPATLDILSAFIRLHLFTAFDHYLSELEKTRRKSGLGQEVVVTSAEPLTDAQRKNLEKELEAKWNALTILREEVDPSVTGGFKLAAADWSYDATVAGRIERLTQLLHI